MTEDSRTVELMADDEVLALFDTSEDPADLGFDEMTRTRVMAYELVRARRRLVHYRTLYSAFIDAGKPYMVENLDEEDGNGIPVKLVFSDDPEHVEGLEAEAEVVVWSEPELLDALTRERMVLDFFTDLLDELAPAVE